MSVTWTDDGAGAAELNGSAFSGGTAATKVWTCPGGNDVWDRTGGEIARDATTGLYRSAYPSSATGGAAGVYAQAVKVTGNSTISPALLDASTPTSGYCCFNRRLYIFTGTAAGTELDIAIAAPVDGSIIKIQRESGDVVVYDDGVEYLRATDSTHTSVIPGLRGTTGQTLDSIELSGDEGVAPGSTTYTLVSAAASVILVT